LLYTTFTVGEKEYKLRLPAKIAVDVERKIGKSLLAVFGEGKMSDLPSIETIVTVLHGSLQTYQHGITMDDAFEIYDRYIENGGSYAGMIQVLVEVLKVSGFFRAAPTTGAGKKAKQ